MQPGLPAAVADGRYPAYNVPVEDLNDDILYRDLPSPPDVARLEKYLVQLVNCQWVQEFHRLLVPRPPISKHPNLVLPTMEKKDKGSADGNDGADQEENDDEKEQAKEDEPNKQYPNFCGLQYLLSYKTQKLATCLEGVMCCS